MFIVGSCTLHLQEADSSMVSYFTYFGVGGMDVNVLINILVNFIIFRVFKKTIETLRRGLTLIRDKSKTKEVFIEDREIFTLELAFEVELGLTEFNMVTKHILYLFLGPHHPQMIVHVISTL